MTVSMTWITPLLAVSAEQAAAQAAVNVTRTRPQLNALIQERFIANSSWKSEYAGENRQG
jgi:hypothetical protein